jgi:Zn-dependent protease
MKALVYLLAAGKLGKLLVSGGSMLLSLGAYALIYGWPYAAGFIAMLLLHELGHYAAARQRGLDVGLPTFIPFLGAWIELKEQPMSVETEAYVALGGPLVGSVAALAAYWGGRYFDSSLLSAIAFAGFFLNLVNLIPITPLDGGRITAIVSPRVWLIGAPILLGLLFWKPSPAFLLIALVAMPQAWAALKGTVTPPGPDGAAAAHYYTASLEKRIEYATYYLGLVVFLGVMVFDLHAALPR